ncbi:uncharacterized protein LOC122507804 [Leptopilina heterotoma]|uniref:uncharacterized protein LOC122507804 n=1 Tax=Leptopilina heterotoma TaxID=63436 RepID=UPI001CA9B172|nr:uncharacterized protein LOC122507804 [Leptopilina heterotoma]
MSIIFSGRNSRSAGLISAIAKQLKAINFQPAKKVTVQFDPFHEGSDSARKFLNYISAPRYKKTNPKCLFKTTIVCDQSEPTITIDLESGEKVVMKSSNLSELELLTLYNKHVTSLVPPPQEEQPTTTKGKKLKKR